MFFNSFMPTPTFDSSGSGGGSNKKPKSPQVPTSSPTPQLRPTTLNTGGLNSPKPKLRPANLSLNTSNTSPVDINSANKVGRRSPPPVNISADTSKSAAGSTGGASGKIKASKAQEENVSVRKAARGTSKYQVTKASKNPLVVNKKNPPVVNKKKPLVVNKKKTKVV